MSKPPRSRINAEKLYKDVVTDDDFPANMEHFEGLQPAFAATAFALVDMGTEKSGHRTRLADQLNVAAEIPRFVTAVSALATEKAGGELPHEIHKEFVKDTVIFNHALEAMIDADPSATFGEVRDFFMDMHAGLYPDATAQEKSAIKEQFTQTLSGMASEIIGEQLAYYLEYDVEDASVEDDMRGIDRFVIIDGVRYGVDFKASSVTANKARAHHPKNFIVSITVPDYIVGGKLRLPPEDVAHYAPLFQKEIEREINRLASVV